MKRLQSPYVFLERMLSKDEAKCCERHGSFSLFCSDVAVTMCRDVSKRTSYSVVCVCACKQ